jgi:hypothetical protein
LTLTYTQVCSADMSDVGPKARRVASLAMLPSVPVNPGVVVSWPEVGTFVRADVDADGWPRSLGLGPDSPVVVRTSSVDLADPHAELDGVGSSRVCCVREVPAAMRELVAHLREPSQRELLAAFGSARVRLAFLINPFPAHDVAGICTSFDVRSGANDVFEMHLGHGQLRGMTRGCTVPDAYVVHRATGVVRECELGGAREAVYLDDAGRYEVRPLPDELVGRSVAEAAGVDVPALLSDFSRWVEETRRGIGENRFHLEFCLDRAGSVVVTDVRVERPRRTLTSAGSDGGRPTT